MKELAIEELEGDGWLPEDFSGDEEHVRLRGR